MQNTRNVDYTSLIRDVPDYPKKGIIFKDLTTLWKDPEAFSSSIEDMADLYKDTKLDKIVGIESRGFIIGSALAYILKKGSSQAIGNKQILIDPLFIGYIKRMVQYLAFRQGKIVKYGRITGRNDIPWFKLPVG